MSLRGLKVSAHTKGSRQNNFTFWPPTHPACRRCENSKYTYIPAFPRLAMRAPRHPKLRTYFGASPKHDGFTLVEMLISLAIFALIGVSAYQVLASSALVSEREQKRTELMHELDRALRIIERDLRQAVDRPVRDELGLRYAFYGAADRPLEFTRAGNENPLRLARSDLLRVGYSLREPEITEQQEDSEQKEGAEDTLNLLRTLWRMPDSSLEAPVNEQRLLSNVVDFTTRFMDANFTWHNAWPLPQVQDANSDNTALPAAIELTLVIAGTGELSRVISLR